VFTDYYKVLGIGKEATEKEIRKAYRQKAKIYHPDSGGDEKEFILLKKAYDTLSNVSQRFSYDRAYDSYYATTSGKRENSKQTNHQSKTEKSKNSQQREHEFHNRKEKKKEESSSRGGNNRYEYNDGAKNRQNNADSKNNERNTSNGNDEKNLKQKNTWGFFASIAANVLLVMAVVFLISNINNQTETIGSLENSIDEMEQFQNDLISERDNLIAEKDELATNLKAANEFVNNTLKYEEKTESSNDEVDNIEVVEDNITKEEPESTGSNQETSNPSNNSYFTLGSSIDEVKTAMGGPPSGMTDYSLSYDLSTVYIEGGRVSGWRDNQDVLNVMIPKTIEAESFGQGSTIQEVVNAMGTPTGYSDYSISYELSTVYIEDGVVTGWRDSSDILKLR
jgi:curved DNA-binding protein CbpA